MSVDRIGDQSLLPAFDGDRPVESAHAGDAFPHAGGEHLSRVVVTGGFADTVEALLLSVARGDQAAFVALQRRMAGLVRVNVRRVLRDASRSEAVTQETFAEVLQDAIHFDPHRDSAQAWLLMRAHQHAVDGLRSGDGTNDPQSAIVDHGRRQSWVSASESEHSS